ncbi:MAG: ral secretion pathway protein [Alphaproteobacteria bacterium]|nr:ral secretion pathway protein [Alphaproteobacteria bacterium]
MGGGDTFSRLRDFATLAAIALSLAFVGCSAFDKVGSGDHVFDEVMSTDLSARFPAPAGRPNPGAPPPRTEIYRGTDSEVVNSAAQNGQEVVESADGFDLNFQNADINAVSKALLGDLLRVSYSVDPRVQGMITLSSARPVSKAQLMPLFESAVKIVGGHLVKEGGIYKIVPAGEALGNGVVDRRTNASAEPGYGITVMPLRYVSAQVVLKALDSFAVKPGMARVDSARNLLLVQGPSTERISAIEAALSLDVDWMKNQSVGIFPIRNSSPDTIIAELQNVFDSGKEGAAANLVRFLPMNRLNAVLAIAQTPKKIDEVATWVRRLDKSDVDNTTVRIYRLRFGNAKIMAGILREVFTGQANTASTTPGQGDLSQLTPGSTLQRATSPDASSSGSMMSGSTSSSTMQGRSPTTSLGTRTDITGDSDQSSNKVSTDVATTPLAGASGPALLPNVRITADTANNSLLIYANRDQYKIVERAIFELDRAPMQVAIDATVAEITLKNELQYGVQFYLQSKYKGNKGSIGFGATDVLKRVIPGGNLVLGSDDDPRVVINALRQVTDVNVLSSPALVVLDNQQALLQVGDEVPIATRSAVDVTVPNAPIVNNIEMRNTGVILKVTPRVNANGVVTLDVIQEISNVVKSDAQTLTPTISQRKVQSSIAVASGQTVLLGGLISNRSEKNKSGLPILSELKAIGDLFAQNVGTSERTELIIFIRPQIIRDGIDAQLVAEELRSKLSIIGRAGISRPPPAAVPPPPPVVVPPIRRQ